MTGQHVLLVEDEPAIATAVLSFLKIGGYSADWARNQEEVSQKISKNRPELVVLDLDLRNDRDAVLEERAQGGSDREITETEGYQLIPKIVDEVGVPVFVVHDPAKLTQDRPESASLVISAGAKDYMSKPLEPKEFLARVYNLCRKQELVTNSNASVAEFDGWKLDFCTRELRAPVGEPVPLTPTESALLEILVREGKRVLTRAELSFRVLGRELQTGDRRIDNIVADLRRKIEKDKKNPSIIMTARGNGIMPGGYWFGINSELS